MLRIGPARYAAGCPGFARLYFQSSGCSSAIKAPFTSSPAG